MISQWSDLYDDLQGILATASGVASNRVILADQGRPPPDPDQGVYATYNPIPVRAYGQPRKSRELVPAVEDFDESALGTGWEDFEETTITQIELMVSCNFIGGSVDDGAARQAAWRLFNASHRVPVFNRLRAASLGWRKASEVKDLTEVIQAGFMPRYQVDLDLFTEAGVTDEILRAAAFSFTLEDRDGNTIASGSRSL